MEGCERAPGAPRALCSRAETLGAVLEERGAAGSTRGIQFGAGSSEPYTFWSYADLLGRARTAAARLVALGVRAGDRVLLAPAGSEAFVAGFFACQLLGAAAVPVVPPRRGAQRAGDLERLSFVARCAEPRVSVLAGGAREDVGGAALGPCLSDEEILEPGAAWSGAAARDADAVAVIQFTSGSTGDPKGVVLTQRAVLTNVRAIGEGIELCVSDVGCTWLPLYHDMGLVGHLLCPLAWDITTVLIPPATFMRHPLSWLRAISEVGATIATGSTYAYALCTRRAHACASLDLDLSSWRLALCGSEPVRAPTLGRFATTFRGFGFDARAFLAVYGLAEFTLAATLPKPGAGLRVERVDRASLECEGVARRLCDTGTRDEDAVDSVCVGRALPGHGVRVVDEAGLPLPDRTVGEIELCGPSRMRGYRGSTGEDAAPPAIRDGWLRTGDCGYLADGDLFVTGRSKELLLIRGRCLHPEDIEAAAATVPGLRADRCAAVAAGDPARGTEKLVVVCERRGAAVDDAALGFAVRRAVVRGVGIRPARVLLVERGTLRRTSSGKLQRAQLRRELGLDLGPGAGSERASDIRSAPDGAAEPA